MRGEADEELQLVVLAQPRAGRLDAGNQFRVHPEEEGRNARIRAKLIAEIVKNYCPRLREAYSRRSDSRNLGNWDNKCNRARSSSPSKLIGPRECPVSGRPRRSHHLRLGTPPRRVEQVGEAALPPRRRGLQRVRSPHRLQRGVHRRRLRGVRIRSGFLVKLSRNLYSRYNLTNCRINILNTKPY